MNIDPALYPLFLAIACILAIVIITIVGSSKGSLRSVRYSNMDPDREQRRIDKRRRIRRWLVWLTILCLLISAAMLIIPRWDKVERNLNQTSQTTETDEISSVFFYKKPAHHHCSERA